MTIATVIVGFGKAGAQIHAPLIAATLGLELAAVVSTRPDAVAAVLGEEVAVYPDLGSALQDSALELVVIAAPNKHHAPLAAQALRAGRDTVVDKPFTLSLAEAEALAGLAAAADRRLAVFHNRRWDDDFLTLQALVASGRLGRVVHFESHVDRWRPQVQQRWREADEPGAGLWWDLGPHLLDQAVQLFGPPETIWADRARQRDGAQAPDWMHAVLGYGEMRAVLHAAALARADTPRFTVHGTGGSFLSFGNDPQEARLAGQSAPTRRHAQWIPAEGAPEALDLIPGDWAAFYRALVAGENPVPLDGALEVMRLLCR